MKIQQATKTLPKDGIDKILPKSLMVAAQASKANMFPYLLQGSQGDSLVVGEFVQETKDEWLRTNGLNSHDHTCAHSSPNKFFLA